MWTLAELQMKHRGAILARSNEAEKHIARWLLSEYSNQEGKSPPT
jgi:hypothetical protein